VGTDKQNGSETEQPDIRFLLKADAAAAETVG